MSKEKEPERNTCPACGTPFCVGILGPGTMVKVICKKKECVHHNPDKPFWVSVPKSSQPG